jgi:YjbE family integral membrane protein
LENEFLVGLMKIILINIVLSGDNAVIVALACRNLEVTQRKKAIFLGSFGAIALRVILTFVAVYLLKIPFVNIIGGLLLLWIAINLLKGEGKENVEASTSLAGAVKTIIVADFVMSLDNVVAVAGVAGGNMTLILIGLAISIPLIIWGSQLLMHLMEKFPIIVVLGAGLLGYTAGEMILKDKAVSHLFENLHHTYHILFPIILAIFVIVIGKLRGSNKTLAH